jgi:hypothetical protein
VDDGTSVECRRLCASADDCPFNFHCTRSGGAAETTYCAADALPVRERAGVWGTACNPARGRDENPACDREQGFFCHALSPADASAYCTRFQCTSDAECKAGHRCARVNISPNADTFVRSIGETLTVCVPRTYCAPCATDLDCPRSGGVQLVCAKEPEGEGSFCTQPCTRDSNCPLDAQCAQRVDRASSGTTDEKVCTPNAGTCKGDGSLCAPCESDADCTNGVCAQASYSTERFCTVRSEVPCTVDGSGRLNARCPGASAIPDGSALACITGSRDPDVPKDHCVGLVVNGITGEGEEVRVLGCHTRRRTAR